MKIGGCIKNRKNLKNYCDMMKRTTTIIVSLALSITLYAQGKGMSLQFHNETLTSALKKIERAGEKNILFAYQETDKYKVSANIRNKKQKEALDIVLQGKPFNYIERNTYFAVQYTGKVAQAAPIKGKVLDEHKQPLPFANVVMLSATDKSYIQGCVTAEDGSFILPSSTKDAMLKVSFVGYKTQTMACKENRQVSRQPNTQQLKTVTVKGSRPDVTYKNGAFVTQVAGTTLSEMGSVSDMIGQLPFVSGEEGEWNIIGRGAPEIYLNGRKIRDLNELKRLNAKDIQSAEVVTMPGSQYSVKTNAVIRLKAVRKRGQGWSGSMFSEYLQGHYSPHHYEDVQLNYRTGGLDIFGEIGAGNDKRQITSKTLTHLNTVNNWEFDDSRTTNMNSGNILLKAGFNYEANEHQSFGMRYETSNIIGNNYAHSWGKTEASKDDEPIEELSFESYSKSRPHWSHSLNAYYYGDFGKWNINLNADYYNKVTKTEQMAMNDGSMDAKSQSRVKSNLYAAKLVASGPLGQGRVTLGTEETFTNRWNDFTQSGFSADAFNHINQSVWAGFAEYNIQHGRMGYALGLRYEYQKTSYYEKNILQREQSPSYHDWIPFASVAYSHKGLNIEFSYRLNKYSPMYSMLQSSIDYNSKYVYSTGDPLLKPQKQHNFNLSGTYKWLSFMAYYNYVLDMYMTWYKPYDEVNHPNILLQTMASVPHSYYYGANVRIAPSFGIWQPNLTASVSFYHANLEHLNIPTLGNQPRFRFSMNNNFKFSHRWFMNLSGYVSPKSAQSNGRRKCMGTMQFRVSKSFLKDEALKVTLVLQDILHTGYYYFEANGTQAHQALRSYSDNQKIGINVRYTFNATKNKYKGSGAGQSEKQRL